MAYKKLTWKRWLTVVKGLLKIEKRLDFFSKMPKKELKERWKEGVRPLTVVVELIEEKRLSNKEEDLHEWFVNLRGIMQWELVQVEKLVFPKNFNSKKKYFDKGMTPSQAVLDIFKKLKVVNACEHRIKMKVFTKRAFNAQVKKISAESGTPVPSPKKGTWERLRKKGISPEAAFVKVINADSVDDIAKEEGLHRSVLVLDEMFEDVIDNISDFYEEIKDGYELTENDKSTIDSMKKTVKNMDKSLKWFLKIKTK